MAKSESEKQAWVDAVERVVQAAGARKAGEEGSAAATRSPAKKCDLVSWDLVATLRPAEQGTVFCALRTGGNGDTTLLGTSNGILAADGGGSSARCVGEGEGDDAEPVYQMAVVPGADQVR